MKQSEDFSIQAPHAERTDDPVMLAKRAIRALETYILTKHDLVVPMGAELEFAVLPQKTQSDYGVTDAAVKQGNYTSSVFRVPKKRDPWFPESRRVTYSYQEEQTDTAWDGMEVVLTHRPSDADGKPMPHSGVTLARSIEALLHQLHQAPSGYKPSKRGKTPAQVGVDGWRQCRKTELAALSTEPVVKGTLTTNGLHLNMSLVDAQTADNVLEHAGAYRATLVDNLSHHVGRMFHENAYLISSGPLSWMRWEQRTRSTKDHPTPCFASQVRCKKNANYLENAIPDASSNPYYATLLQLAGTVEALDCGAFTYHETEPFYRASPAPVSDGARDWSSTSADRLKQDFMQASTLRDVLNRCEPTLGDRFMAAIEKTPPGTERAPSRKGRCD